MSVVATLNSSTFYLQTSRAPCASRVRQTHRGNRSLRSDCTTPPKARRLPPAKRGRLNKRFCPARALKSGQWIISDAPESIKYSRTFLQVIIHPSIVISVNSPSSELRCGGGDLGEIKGPRSSAAEPSCSLLARPPSPWPQRGRSGCHRARRSWSSANVSSGASSQA
jgi:hypothetical protein